MSIKVLLAEDDPEMREVIEGGLQKAGMSVEAYDNIDDIHTSLMTQSYDVLVLDRMLKAKDSLKSLKELREMGAAFQKILILSGHSGVKDKIEGLDLGADEYLSKPFDMRELIARIRMLVRRAEDGLSAKRDSLIEILDIRLNLDTKQMSRMGESLDLTAKEFKIIYLLALHHQKIFSRTELLERIWDAQEVGSNVVEAAMARLRAKVNIPGLPKIIHCKRGVGYWLGLTP